MGRVVALRRPRRVQRRNVATDCLFVTPARSASERRESDEEKARQILTGELVKLKWTETDLRNRRKSDPRKVRIARRLRKQTTMTLKWVARELHMGAWTNVSNLLSQANRKG